MKKIGLGILVVATVFFLTSCGVIEKTKSELSYKTIVGETGDIIIYTGNSETVFKDVKITYSDSDTMAVMFKDVQNNYYYQDGLLFVY